MQKRENNRKENLMKRFGQRSRQLLSVLLAVFLVAGSVPLQALAEQNTVSGNETIYADTAADTAAEAKDAEAAELTAESGAAAAEDAAEDAAQNTAEDTTAAADGGMLEPIDISEEGLAEAQTDFDALALLMEQEAEGDELSAEGASAATLQTAADYLRSRVVARKQIVSLDYITDEKNPLTALKSIVTETFAEREEGEPYEGDYLYWNMSSYKYGVKKISGGFRMLFLFAYHSTADQELYVNTRVALLKQQLGLTSAALTDAEKILAAYDYITANVQYDFENYLSSNPNEKIYTAYGALADGRAVCQGYAMLMYRLMKEAGIGVRLIPGYGKKEAHGWNIVRIAGVYYNVDSTWDSTIRQETGSYSYFLKNEEEFTEHVRFDAYRTSDFHAEYPMAQYSYVMTGSAKDAPLKLKASGSLPTFGVTAARNSNSSLTLSWGAVAGATQYEVYLKGADQSYIWQQSVAGNQATLVIAPPAALTYRVAAVARTNGRDKVIALSADTPVDGKVIYPQKGSRFQSDLCTYKVLSASDSSRTVAVSAIQKTAVTADIPATMQWDGLTYKVTQISAKACKNRTKLKTVYIGKNVKKIGAGAFGGCKKLRNIVIRGKSLKKIGSKAFSKTKVKTVSAPSGKKKSYLKSLKKAGVSKKAKFYAL